jgi:Proteasome subunit
VVIATEKKLPALIDPSSLSKINMITERIGMAYSGMGPDSRVLVRKARKIAMQYNLYYKDDIPVLQMVQGVASVMQEFTQSGGVRPFGVSLLISGFDALGPQVGACLQVFSSSLRAGFFVFSASLLLFCLKKKLLLLFFASLLLLCLLFFACFCCFFFSLRFCFFFSLYAFLSICLCVVFPIIFFSSLALCERNAVHARESGLERFSQHPLLWDRLPCSPFSISCLSLRMSVCPCRLSIDLRSLYSCGK